MERIVVDTHKHAEAALEDKLKRVIKDIVDRHLGRGRA